MSSFASSSPEPCPAESEILALVCGELEPEARARLLAHTERCSGCAVVVAEAGLALTESDGSASMLPATRAYSGVFSAGQLVASRYLIERRIGRGGMGEVYAALDQEFEDRVALKTISPAFAADHSVVDRFKLELRLARRISHPSVCRVFEFGRHEPVSGPSQCFFTLQFIEGVTLRRRLLDGGPLELVAAVQLAEKLALGLQAIHAQNVVHRDIKPENVMLTSEQGAAAAIWVDFGLARVDLRETVSVGLLAGTPDYSAPELLRGEVASRSSDLYAFGVVLYEVLTGALPFPRSTSFAAASQQAGAGATAPAPSTRRTGVPATLDALVLACLHALPEHRPASAEHVATRLHEVANVLRAERARAERSAPSGSTPTGSATRRWRLPLSLALAAAAGAGLALYRPLIEPRPPSTAARSPEPALPTPPATISFDVTIAKDPAAPERRTAPKRALPAPSASPADSPDSPEAAATSHPPITDFGGRR